MMGPVPGAHRLKLILAAVVGSCPVGLLLIVLLLEPWASSADVRSLRGSIEVDGAIFERAGVGKTWFCCEELGRFDIVVVEVI